MLTCPTAAGRQRKTQGLMTSIRERNKELILRAASEEFADKGFAATKTSDIAAKAGLPKPNVYYYFKSKENLYREVLESIIEPLLAASAPFNQPSHPSEVLTAYIRSKIPRGRFVEVEEIANMVGWLASAECSFTTAAVFDISGGRATY